MSREAEVMEGISGGLNTFSGVGAEKCVSGYSFISICGVIYFYFHVDNSVPWNIVSISRYLLNGVIIC